MSVKFKILYHFNDGVTWDIDEVGYDANQIAMMLGALTASSNIEVSMPLTGETRKASEIKSIELVL